MFKSFIIHSGEASLKKFGKIPKGGGVEKQPRESQSKFGVLEFQVFLKFLLDSIDK